MEDWGGIGDCDCEAFDGRNEEMNLEDIPIYRRAEYIKTCDLCGLNQMILAQRDNSPEYEYEIYLHCQCGNYIEFILPVN